MTICRATGGTAGVFRRKVRGGHRGERSLGGGEDLLEHADIWKQIISFILPPKKAYRLISPGTEAVVVFLRNSSTNKNQAKEGHFTVPRWVRTTSFRD
jgi:hypothetical protein